MNPKLREILFLLILIPFFGALALSFYHNYVATQKLSSLFYLVFEITIILFLLVRKIPREVSNNFEDWLYAVSGTLSSLLFRPLENPHESNVLVAMQLVGMFVSYAGLVSLNKSLGIVPANRGIKQGGIFKYIRHPLYAGYIITYFAFCLQNPTTYNALILAIFVGLTLSRIKREERFLLQDASYAAYTQKVKWRILPLVW
jgi:protein-S-isoprenylcysteine O-methyltransferase Ste14